MEAETAAETPDRWKRIIQMFTDMSVEQILTAILIPAGCLIAMALFIRTAVKNHKELHDLSVFAKRCIQETEAVVTKIRTFESFERRYGGAVIYAKYRYSMKHEGKTLSVSGKAYGPNNSSKDVLNRGAVVRVKYDPDDPDIVYDESTRKMHHRYRGEVIGSIILSFFFGTAAVYFLITMILKG
ncbi:MAG: DUF3592 domain-containing protein [Lachnospiraceae bacterium]|nr:DUF3592 domain-containing protein [Lachnospiraceae bacterium]